MSPSIRGPQSYPSEGYELPRRSMPPPPRPYLLEGKETLRDSIGGYPKTSEVGSHASVSDAGIAAVLDALEAWKAQAAEKAARTESKILWSLLALEARISQSLEEAADAREGRGEGPSFEQQALGEWINQVAEVFARIESRLLSSLEALEKRLRESENGLAQRLEELAAGAQRSWNNQIQLLSQLVGLQENMGGLMEAVEERIEANNRNQETNLERLRQSMLLLENKASREQGTFSQQLAEVLSSVSDLLEKSKAEARLEKVHSDQRLLRALEALETRIAQILVDDSTAEEVLAARRAPTEGQLGRSSLGGSGKRDSKRAVPEGRGLNTGEREDRLMSLILGAGPLGEESGQPRFREVKD